MNIPDPPPTGSGRQSAARPTVAVPVPRHAVIQSGGVPVMMSLLTLPQWVLELIAVHPRGHHRDERRNDRNAPGDREDSFRGHHFR